MKKENITESIKTFEDAMKATGRPDVPDFLNLPEDLRDYFTAQYKMAVITEALNEGWKADWENGNQKKWIPWFEVSPSGLVVRDAWWCGSCALAGCASHLCKI